MYRGVVNVGRHAVDDGPWNDVVAVDEWTRVLATDEPEAGDPHHRFYSPCIRTRTRPSLPYDDDISDSDFAMDDIWYGFELGKL
jgi:hypothetical protein